ncbi:hypothetical protein [Sinomicrobium sp. M5D2P9]
MKLCILFPVLTFCLITAIPAWAQTVLGFWTVNRIGVSYQRAWGLDVGVVSYNSLYGRKQHNFWDVSLGVEFFFVKP